MDRTYTLHYLVDDASALRAFAAVKKGIQEVSREAMLAQGAFMHLDNTIQQVTQSLGQLQAPLAAAQTEFGGMRKSLLDIVPLWFIIDKGIEAVGQLGEKANTARDRFKEMAEEIRDMRDDFRELANLQKKDGPDDLVVAETVKKGMAAGMVPQEARKFMEQFEGSLPAGIQKGFIDHKIGDEIAAEGMKFGTRVKLDPETAGDLAGVLGSYHRVRNGNDAAAFFGQIAYGLNEGRGNLEPLTRSLIKTAGAIVEEDGGAVDSLPQVAVLLGAASQHATPDAAGTKVRKAVRALRQFSGAQGEGLKSMNILPTDDHFAAFDKLAAGFDQAKKDGKAPDIFLRERGFKDEAEITALVEEYHDQTVIKKRMGKFQDITGDSVQKQNAAYLKSTVNGQSRMVRAAKEGQKMLLGIDAEKLAIAKDAAEIEMRDEGKVGGFWNNAQEWIGDWGGAKTNWLGQRSTKDRWLEEEAFRKAKEAKTLEWKRQGLSDSQITKKMKDEYGLHIGKGFDDHSPEYWNDDAGRRKLFNNLMRGVEQDGELQSAFGKPEEKVVPKLDQLLHATIETNKILKDTAGIRGPENAAQRMWEQGGGIVMGAAVPGRTK